jgi:glutathione S-transferase
VYYSIANNNKETTMEAIAIITGLAVLQAFWFAFEVGKARQAHNIPAPAMSGDAEFERVVRVHQNTVEQLGIFLPGLWMFAYFVNPYGAAAVGVVYLVARMIYRSSYRIDPKSRGTGFGLTALSMMVLVLGGMGGAIWRMIQG